MTVKPRECSQLLASQTHKTSSDADGYILGAPSPDFTKGIKNEHCVMWGCEEEFTTTNYGIVTTPLKEYEISTGTRTCPETELLDRKGMRVRVIRQIEELKELKLCKKACLTDDEILAVVRVPPHRFHITCVAD
jgi:hypothetical protein